MLVSPREQTVVNGRRVRFVWKPVEGASAYRVQVAESPDFDAILFEDEVEGRTELVVEDEFPLDEDTYFWRVVVRDSEGLDHGGDNIESFISATREDEDLKLGAPDEDEKYGPAERLFRGATAEAAAEVTGSPRYVDEASHLGVEHEGIEAGQILGFALATAVAIGLAVFALFQYVHIVSNDVRYTAAGLSGYPELRQVELEATQRLSQYGPVEGEEGVYRIPIDRAIELMAQEAQEEEREYSDELNLQPPNR